MSATQNLTWATVLVPLLSAICGGLVVHFLSLLRDKTAKRREILVKEKMDLWRLLDKNNGLAEDSIGNKNYNPTGWEEIARCIQLVGSDEQIKLFSAISTTIGNSADAPQFATLMNSLQNDLRKELGMPVSKIPYFWLRIKSATQSTPDQIT